jgi:hypothetical protein
MKRLATLAFFFGIVLNGFSQSTNPDGDKDSFVTEVQASYDAYQVKLDEVNQQLEEGKISAEMALELKSELHIGFQEQLALLAENAGEQLWGQEEEMLESTSENPTFEDEVANLNLEPGTIDFSGNPVKVKPWKKRKFTGSGLTLGIGNRLMALDVNQEFVPSDWLPETGDVGVVTWDLFFQQRRLGRSPLWIRSGLTWDFYTVDFGTQTYITTDLVPGMNGIYLVEDPANTFRNSSLSTSYLTLPLWLYVNSSRTGRKGFSAAAGLYGGIRMGSATRGLRYMDNNNGWTRERVSSRFYTNPISAGVQFRLGYKKWHFTARQSVTPLFNPRLDIVRPDVYVASLALGWDWE